MTSEAAIISDSFYGLENQHSIYKELEAEFLDVERPDWYKVTISILVCSIGLFGNSLVILLSTVSKDYKKSVTNWYVLQLAIADTLFLLTLPFKANEDINNAWEYPNWLCKVKECILFVNYNASVLFLMIMSVDRYIAVCHIYSENLKKLRYDWAASCITIIIWIVSVLLSTPIAIYSTKTGTEPNCKCQYEFGYTPKNVNWTEKCLDSLFDKSLLSKCIGIANELNFDKTKTEFCRKSDADRLDQLYDIAKNINVVKSDYDDDVLYFKNLTVISSLNKPSFSFYENYTEYDYIDYSSYPNEQGSQISTCDYSGATFIWKGIILFNFIVMFLCPLIVMAVSYGLVIFKVRESHMRSSIRVIKGKKTLLASKKSIKDRKRVTTMCISLVVAFTFCWTMYHAIHLAKLFGVITNKLCYTLGAVGGLLGYLNSALNPFLYTFLGSNFSRHWTKRSLRKIKWRQNISKSKRLNLTCKNQTKKPSTNKKQESKLNKIRCSTYGCSGSFYLC